MLPGKIWYTIILFVAFNSLVVGAPVASIKPNHSYDLKAGENEITIENIRIKIIIKKADLLEIDQRMLYGLRGDGEDLEIVNIGIKIYKEEVFIPYGMYAKVLNPRELFVEKRSKSAVNIKIHGGDAGSSYFLELKFSDSRLIEVTMRDPENLGSPLWSAKFPKPKRPMD